MHAIPCPHFHRRLDPGNVPASTDTIAGRASVSDGDTIEIRGQRIGLYGIDAPELYQSCEDAQGMGYSCGIAPKGMLIAGMGGSTITCEGKDRDRYGRLIAICWTIDGINLGAAMVRDGREWHSCATAETMSARKRRRAQ